MSTYYRKLEPGEITVDGDGYFSGHDGQFYPWSGVGIGRAARLNGDTNFRPVTITEAKSEPPAHRERRFRLEMKYETDRGIWSFDDKRAWVYFESREAREDFVKRAQRYHL